MVRIENEKNLSKIMRLGQKVTSGQKVGCD